MSGTTSAATAAPRRWASGRFQPTRAPMNPTATPPSDAHARKSVQSRWPRTSAASSSDQATATARAATRTTLAQPSAGAFESRARAAFIMRRGSPQATVRATGHGPGARIRRGRGGGRGPSEPAAPQLGRSGWWTVSPARRRSSRSTWSAAAASTVTTTEAMPRVRSAAMGRTQDGSTDDGDDDRGHPPPEPPGRAYERLGERRRPVALDGGEQLHDLQVLAAAAVGRA